MTKIIQVVKPRHEGYVEAVVDDEDYDTVLRISNRWRLSHNGYAVFVVKRFGRLTTFYMHKVIHGSSARHINGNRLDNRRCNLTASQRKPAESEIVMRGSDFQYELHYDDRYLKQFGPDTWLSVKYKDGKMYSGHTDRGVPEGYGRLEIPKERKDIRGLWKKGIIVDGMISHYHYQGDLKAIELVKNGVVVL